MSAWMRVAIIARRAGRTRYLRERAVIHAHLRVEILPSIHIAETHSPCYPWPQSCIHVQTL